MPLDYVIDSKQSFHLFKHGLYNADLINQEAQVLIYIIIFTLISLTAVAADDIR
jgi:hypothetical protein